MPHSEAPFSPVGSGDKSVVFLGLGSNLGDRKTYLQTALNGLKNRGLKILATSGIYETPPWGNTDQDAFLNMVVKGEFSGTPGQLLELALDLEIEMGRIRAEKWGPRLIDLDLIEFGGQSLDQPGLTLPHPWYLERAFVLVPMAEIAPDFIPTGQNLPLSHFLEKVAHDAREVKWVGKFP
ncbi:MAG: 2-amino-4-hydroxy-6-hydroxymethyldihydropteridine diphosphokinase [Bacteroidia bacterium]|nr:2-amino-4-hydroxy-6-hydroxymethyldihydropteridine diphosphokinase [Bacteroidia bacterium]